ncbi:MAG: hypothetical protein IJX87_02490 [Clostridia bacterium]|nr:hypothetical protein [Clostridia bacterium]
MPISKTDFVRALQCPKMLWLDAHMPQLRVIPPEVQSRLDMGNEFGDQAMGIFGPFVETTVLREDGRLYYAEMIRKTQALLQAGEPVICEASFTWYGNFCAADILKKEDGGYNLYEVKNTDSVRKEFITDLGFQRFLLRKCGVNILASKLVLRGDTEQGEQEKQAGQGCVERIKHNDFVYKIVDVSSAVKRAERLVEKHIFEFGKLKRKDADCPLINVGEHCDTPYACWYQGYCKANDSIAATQENKTDLPQSEREN